MNVSLTGSDWLSLFAQFLLLSCLSVGGAITTTPEMHRFLVDSHQWLTNQQFVTSIALAQAAPGPNILFVALVGWNVGLNAGGGLANGLVGWTTAFAGAFVAMAGMLIPSTTLTYVATRWGHRNRELRAVRAFKQGMAPIVVGLLIATGWVLVRGDADSAFNPATTAVALVSMLVVWRTRVHLLWLLGAGALLGATGLV
ncbi:MAG: chromate transporter [Acidobacteria bacterium]|nr:chromate transporter [Acidobacteriota bacterium]